MFEASPILRGIRPKLVMNIETGRMRVTRKNIASAKKKAKLRARDLILERGAFLLPVIPGETRRERFSTEMKFRKKAYEELAQWASEQPKGSIQPKVALRCAQSARILKQPELSRELIESAYGKAKTDPELLTELALDRYSDGDTQAALAFVKRAIILNPGFEPAIDAYLTIRRDIEAEPALDRALLRRHKGRMSLVWKFCKHCRSKEDFAAISDALKLDAGGDTSEDGDAVETFQTDVVIPVSYVRPYANAALRAEQFDHGRSAFVQAIQALSVAPPEKAKPAKTIGSSGTQALIDIVKLLDGAGVPYFAAAGTCLGMVREGRPLAHDNDIDIGIMDGDWDRERLKALIADSPLFTFDQPHPKSPKIGAIHRKGASIDLFRFYEENGLIWHNGVFVRWGNKPFAFETRDLNGTSIRIPAGAEYLVENYGDWETPDPFFDAFLNGPNREVIWPEYYAAHFLRTIYLTIMRGKRDKAIGFIKDGIADKYLTRLEKDQLAVVLERLEELGRSAQSNGAVGHV